MLERHPCLYYDFLKCRPVKRWLLGIQPKDIFGGNARDFTEGFSREKCLVRGDEYIGKGEQEVEFVVLQQMLGMVFKENTFFFLVDIKSDAAEVTCFECIEKRGGVDEFATAGVDEIGAVFHLLDSLATEEMEGLRGKREMQGNDVTVLQ